MGYQQIGNGTVCEDTPQNRREFEDFCRMINAPGRYQKMAKEAKAVLEQEKKTVDVNPPLINNQGVSVRAESLFGPGAGKPALSFPGRYTPGAANFQTS